MASLEDDMIKELLLRTKLRSNIHTSHIG